jgi:hypothetical protein
MPAYAGMGHAVEAVELVTAIHRDGYNLHAISLSAFAATATMVRAKKGDNSTLIQELDR